MPLKANPFQRSVSLLNPHAILDTIGVIGTNSIQYIGSENGLSHLQLLSFLGFGL